jgi:hypothetical protein
MHALKTPAVSNSDQESNESFDMYEKWQIHIPDIALTILTILSNYAHIYNIPITKDIIKAINGKWYQL